MQRVVPHHRRSGRRSSALRATLPALALGLALAGCSDPGPKAPKVATPTPLASYDGTTAAVQRISFCTRIPTTAVAAAVDEPGSTRHYANGQQGPDAKDVAHEYGCIFDGKTGLVARAWVFAPPVTPADATRLVTTARKQQGCRALDTHQFGSPALGTLCRTPAATTVTYRGLFGDAWLSCSLAVPVAAKLTDTVITSRAGEWCVQVATTAAS
jgi:hypothetical protein